MKQMFLIELTEKEIKLLEDVMLIGADCEKQIKEAIKKNKKYILKFTGEELEDLAGYVAAEANHTKSKSKGKSLDLLSDKIEDLLEGTEYGIK